MSILAHSAYLGARIDYYNSLLNSSEKDAALRELQMLFSAWKGRFVPCKVDFKLEDILEQPKPQHYLSTTISNHRYLALVEFPDTMMKSRIVSNAESQFRWLLVYPTFGSSARNFRPLLFQIA